MSANGGTQPLKHASQTCILARHPNHRERRRAAVRCVDERQFIHENRHSEGIEMVTEGRPVASRRRARRCTTSRPRSWCRALSRRLRPPAAWKGGWPPPAGPALRPALRRAHRRAVGRSKCSKCRPSLSGAEGHIHAPRWTSVRANPRAPQQGKSRSRRGVRHLCEIRHAVRITAHHRGVPAARRR